MRGIKRRMLKEVIIKPVILNSKYVSDSEFIRDLEEEIKFLRTIPIDVLSSPGESFRAYPSSRGNVEIYPVSEEVSYAERGKVERIHGKDSKFSLEKYVKSVNKKVKYNFYCWPRNLF